MKIRNYAYFAEISLIFSQGFKENMGITLLKICRKLSSYSNFFIKNGYITVIQLCHRHKMGNNMVRSELNYGYVTVFVKISQKTGQFAATVHLIFENYTLIKICTICCSRKMALENVYFTVLWFILIGQSRNIL